MEISTLADEDFVRFVAHYNHLLLNPKKKVNPKLKDRGYSDEALAEAKLDKRQKFQPVESCGLRFTKPFDHLSFEPFSYVLTLFENYSRGCLPFPGSVSEQPAQIMEFFSVIETIRREQEAKLSETLRGRNQHKNRTRASR
jgi:hypothetical protein